MSRLNVGSIEGLASENFRITVPTGSRIVQAGSILQVVSVAKTDTQTMSSVAVGSAVDITGLSATITPTLLSSRVLVVANVCGGAFASAVFGNGAVAVQLVRGSTEIAEGDASGSMSRVTSVGGFAGNVNGNPPSSTSFAFLDSPNTTSATTYKLQLVNAIGTNNTATLYVNRAADETNAAWVPRPISTLTLMEVGG